MHIQHAYPPVSQQLLLIAEYLFGLSKVANIAILTFFFIDRWLVSHRGIPGDAVIEEYELIRSLPSKLWEVRLKIIPEDIPNVPLHYRMGWSDSDFANRLENLSIGAKLRVRFRRSPRRITMPAR